MGDCAPRFEPVRAALAGLLRTGDTGASVAVRLHGDPVVDLWGGYADAARTVPWERDTSVCVNSTTKTMTALCALVLADRGALDLSAPVADYWPEFAAAGKEGVRVRHVLSHTAGLPELSGQAAVEELYDWEDVTGRLAAQAPAWEPGTAAGYHALTFGFLVGELVRRVSGRLPGEFFAEEIAGPLGADFHIGLSAEHDGRIAPLLPPLSETEEFAAAAPGAGAATVAPGTVRVRDVNSVAWRRAQVPATSGFGHARSVAHVQSVLVAGGAVGGVRLLSAAGCSPAREELFRGQDRVLGTPMAWTAGFGRFGDAFGWGGWGGSLVVNDPGSGLTVAYVMNRMVDGNRRADERGMEIVTAAFGCL
ncbi:serine hydrolase domain-containing protein [Streptomyces sp. NPDC097619]|uniref:serine hydrolase domain-containing protein n=1 Tax=Streptomyces sp. NPDC097619 TaxID=3157228 RepID=UPI003321298A